MIKKNIKLTESEEELMELFWSTDEALASVDILNTDGEHSWNNSYLHIMIRSLIKKGMIEVCGVVQSGTQYARQFVPSMTKEEYAAKIVMSKGLEINSVAKVAAAMVEETDGGAKEELIEELEKIIKELRDEEGEK